jgi:predicted acetyltransferase
MDMSVEPPFDDRRQRRGALTSAQSAQMSLEIPSEKYVDSFFQAMAEFEAEGLPQISKDMTREQFPAYVQKLHDQAEGKNLKEGHVPSKEFWMIDAEGYAGRIILGLSFTPSPERVGHHVGYAVRTSRRRRGYATNALRCLLDEARKLKIYKLMPSCGAANVASRKVIESNGGVLLNPAPNDEISQEELRFLIDLEPTPA